MAGVREGVGRKFGSNLGRSVWTRESSPHLRIGGKTNKKSAWAEKKSASEASQEAVWKGKRWTFPLSQTIVLLALLAFARRYFSYLSPFFAFSPIAEAGLRLA